jgi:hypothetical protein
MLQILLLAAACGTTISLGSPSETYGKPFCIN